MPLDITQQEVDGFTRAFREKAVFYLDESVESYVANALRALGYKTKSFGDFGMSGRPDEDHAALCWREGMLLVTKDHDFLDARRFPEHRSPGTVVIDAGPGEESAVRAAFFVASIVGPFGTFWRGSKLLISNTGEVTVWSRAHDTGAVEKSRFRWLPRRDVERWVDEAS